MGRHDLDQASPRDPPASPRRRVDGLRQGHRQHGPIRRFEQRWPPARRHLDLGRHDLDQAVSRDQPACPVWHVDGLRRGHRQHGPVQRRNPCRDVRRYLGLGRFQLDQQSPATSPPARRDATMAYDAATRTVVLFSGVSSSLVADTWVWDGATWTKQSPATHPTARFGASMAYDAATGNVVLFSGLSKRSARLGDTWTWDGVNWAKQAPATARPAGLARRWPTTRPPATWSCSADSTGPRHSAIPGSGALASQRSNLAHHRVSCPLRPARRRRILVTGCGVCAGRT